jgi:hypothetical protein
MGRKWCVLASASLILAGCTDVGPLPVYTEAGVPAPDPRLAHYPNVNPVSNFQLAAQQVQTSPSTATYDELMRSGFALIYIRCNAYFDGKGTDQAKANLLRDLIAPVAAVVTGIFALHTYKNPANANHDIALLTLGTTTAVSGLDVYSKNFLFGADNIEAVRQMVNEELNTHAATALGLHPTNIEEAILQIVDNERICLPSHILASTRAAIAKGKFDAQVSGTGDPVSSDLLTQLDTALNVAAPAAITDTQAGFLYAAITDLVKTPAQMKLVRMKLSNLPEADNPVADDGKGGYSIKSDTDFPFSKLKQIFDAAPLDTRTYLANQSVVVMAGAESSAQADVAAMAKIGIRAALPGATRDANFRAFTASSSAQYTLPSAGGLRRIRVTAQ